MSSKHTVEIMGVNASTEAEADFSAADHFVLADVWRNEEGSYVDHSCREERYASAEEARAALDALDD